MKTISFFCSILIIFMLTGCLEPNCCTPQSSNLLFVNLRNNEGSNLLDPQTAGAIDLSKTRLYLLENGAPKMFKFEGGGVLDDPYGVAPVGIDGKSGARISFTYDGNEKEIDGFIQWNETIVDSLTFTFNSAEKPSFIAKVSQKGTVLWDLKTAPENTEAVITLEH